MPATTPFHQEQKRILTMQREKLLMLIRLDISAVLIGYGFASDYAKELAREFIQKLK